MTKDKKGADTSLMVGGKSVPVNQGVADPPPEKLTPKEVLESIEDHFNRINALEEAAFGDVTEKLEEIVKAKLVEVNEKTDVIVKALVGAALGGVIARLDALDLAVFEEEETKK